MADLEDHALLYAAELFRYSSEARMNARARSIWRRIASSDSPKKGSAESFGELDIQLIQLRQVFQIKVLATSKTSLSVPPTWFHTLSRIRSSRTMIMVVKRVQDSSLYHTLDAKFSLPPAAMY